MTLQQLVESVEAVFGRGMRQRILKEFDLAQKTLCSQAELLEESGSLSDVDTYTSWELPSRYVNLTRIDFFDSDGYPLYIENLDITYEIYDGYIYFMSTTTTPITKMPTDIAYIVLRYTKLPSDIDTTDSTVDIDEVEYPAMEALVRERLYSQIPMPIGIDREGNQVKAIDHRSLSYWSEKYKEFRREAKKRNNLIDSTGSEPIYYAHTGQVYFLKHNKETSISTISIPSYSTLYTKYVRFSAISPGTFTEITKLGFGDLSYAMDGNDIVITSADSEFTTTMWAKDIQHSSYNYVSTSEFRFTPRPYLAWGTDIIELYIY